MYKPKNFDIKELVCRYTFESHEEWKLWLMFDERILRAMQQLRDDFGRFMVNNWHREGTRTESGLRVPGMDNYSDTSQHAFGRAIDSLPMDSKLMDIRMSIRGDRRRYELISGMEIGKSVTWLHIDCGNRADSPGELKLFRR